MRAETTTRLPRLVLGLLALCAAGLASGCDYPEEGFYELVLRPAQQAERAHGLLEDDGKLHLPFMVEELTDDTDLTIGFNLLLPRKGALVLVPLDNSTDRSRRGWHLAAASADTGYGDLELLLTHYEERLSFEGKFRGSPTGPVLSYGSSLDPENNRGRIDPPLTVIAAGKAIAVGIVEVRQISQKDFERVLGRPVDKALRETAVKPEALPEAQASAPPPEPAPDPKAADKAKHVPRGRGTGRS